MLCPICFSLMSDPVAELFALPSVASDCRPWSKGRSVRICSGCGVMKRVTNQDFAHDVYKEYTSYPEPTGRTQKILEFVKDKMPLPTRILDIGAGDGHGMRVMQNFYPDALVFGYEPTINKERPNDKFDLITLFHVFEHIEDLHEMLAYIKSSLTDNGRVLIQVPYAIMWPFDLIIADHEWHFNTQSLAVIVGEFFNIDYGGNGLIEKELTFLVSHGQRQYGKYFYKCDGRETIDWLLSFKKKLDAVKEAVAVYGTSVSAMWTAQILGNKIEYYIDDDKTRYPEFNGKSVWPPQTGYLPIVASFPDWQLKNIKQKHQDLQFL